MGNLWRGAALVAAATGWCIACAGAEAPPAAPAPAPPPAAAPTRAPEAAVTPDPRAEAIVSEALARVSALRQLPAKRGVRAQSLSRAEMARRVREHIDREVPSSVIAGQTALLVGLGLVDPDFDYVETIIELMGTQLAGFYEPADATMYLAEDLDGVDARVTLAHELVHALQDQHYGLQRLIEYRESEGDAQAAVHALAEGDATSAMLDELLSDQNGRATDLSDSALRLQINAGVELSASVASVPSIIKRSVIAPYADGVRFVHALRRQGGWAAVDAAWHEPPATTEQLLHPEKYAAREAAAAVDVAAAPAGWPTEPIYTDTMGEQTLQLVFGEWMPRVAADQAAAGWGGDRVSVFRNGERWVTAWELHFDAESDAVEAGDAFARRLDRGALALEHWRCAVLRESQVYGVWRRGRQVRVTLGGPGGTCESARQWAGRWSRSDPRSSRT